MEALAEKAATPAWEPGAKKNNIKQISKICRITKIPFWSLLIVYRTCFVFDNGLLNRRERLYFRQGIGRKQDQAEK